MTITKVSELLINKYSPRHRGKVTAYENIYGKTIKPKYEVALKQHVKGSVDDDYESIEFHSANNYWESVRMAKKYSFGIGSEINALPKPINWTLVLRK